MSGDEQDFLTQMVGKPEAKSEPDTPEPEARDEPEGVTEPDPPEPTAETPSATPDKESHVPLAALMAERDKRKEASRKAEELEKRIKELEQATKPEPTLPDFYQNPERYVQEVIGTVEARASDRLYAALEEAERERHEDFDDVMKAVMDRAKDNPALAQQIMSAKNPAAAAYKLGKKALEFDQLQADPDSYRAKVEAEVRAKIAKEQELAGLKQQQADALAASIPPDLSSERSAVSSPRPRNKSTVIDQMFPKT